MKTRLLIIIGIAVTISTLYASISMNNDTNDLIGDSQRNSVDIFQDFVNSQKRADAAMNKWVDNMLHSDDDLVNTMAILEAEKTIQDNLFDEYVNLPDSEKTNEEIHSKIMDPINYDWLSDGSFIESLKPQKEAERDFRITLEHNGCAKTCPVYSVIINGDGTVLYKGLKNVEKAGKQEYEIPTDTITELNRFLFELYHGNIKTEYGSQDGAENTVIITIEFGNTIRIVNHDNSGPELLKQFEEKIEEIAMIKEFI